MYAEHKSSGAVYPFLYYLDKSKTYRKSAMDIICTFHFLLELCQQVFKYRGHIRNSPQDHGAVASTKEATLIGRISDVVRSERGPGFVS